MSKINFDAILMDPKGQAVQEPIADQNGNMPNMQGWIPTFSDLTLGDFCYMSLSKANETSSAGDSVMIYRAATLIAKGGEVDVPVEMLSLITKKVGASPTLPLIKAAALLLLDPAAYA